MRAPSSLQAIGNTPLIELAALRPEGGARILLKWEGANPTGSMKDRMALAMLERAEAEGLLKPGQAVVEYTGGSTGSSLAFVCAAKGYPLHIVTADCFAEEKIQTMRALGAKVEVFETPEKKVHPGLVRQFEERVAQLVEETGAYWTNQMGNPHQLDGYAALAEELLADCPEITDLVQVVGTAGSSIGTARTLKKARPGLRLTVVEPAEAPYLSKGAGGTHRVEGIAVRTDPPLLDRSLVDAVMPIPEEDGRAQARRLAQTDGLLVGTSTGLNLAAAIEVAKSRGKDGAVVTLGVDTGLKYLAGDLFAGSSPSG